MAGGVRGLKKKTLRCARCLIFSSHAKRKDMRIPLFVIGSDSCFNPSVNQRVKSL